MEKTKKYLTTIAIIVLTFFSFVVGWMFGFNEHVSIVKEAKATEVTTPETPAMTSSTKYERVYCYGHNYVIFWKYDNDFEVLQLD